MSLILRDSIAPYWGKETELKLCYYSLYKQFLLNMEHRSVKPFLKQRILDIERQHDLSQVKCYLPETEHLNKVTLMPFKQS